MKGFRIFIVKRPGVGKAATMPVVSPLSPRETPECSTLSSSRWKKPKRPPAAAVLPFRLRALAMQPLSPVVSPTQKEPCLVCSSVTEDIMGVAREGTETSGNGRAEGSESQKHGERERESGAERARPRVPFFLFSVAALFSRSACSSSCAATSPGLGRHAARELQGHGCSPAARSRGGGNPAPFSLSLSLSASQEKQKKNPTHSFFLSSPPRPPPRRPTSSSPSQRPSRPTSSTRPPGGTSTSASSSSPRGTGRLSVPRPS